MPAAALLQGTHYRALPPASAPTHNRSAFVDVVCLNHLMNMCCKEASRASSCSSNRLPTQSKRHNNFAFKEYLQASL